MPRQLFTDPRICQWICVHRFCPICIVGVCILPKSWRVCLHTRLYGCSDWHCRGCFVLSVYRAYVLLTCAFFNLNRAPLEDTRGRLWKACPSPSSQALAPELGCELGNARHVSSSWLHTYSVKPTDKWRCRDLLGQKFCASSQLQPYCKLCCSLLFTFPVSSSVCPLIPPLSLLANQHGWPWTRPWSSNNSLHRRGNWKEGDLGR